MCPDHWDYLFEKTQILWTFIPHTGQTVWHLLKKNLSHPWEYGEGHTEIVKKKKIQSTATGCCELIPKATSGDCAKEPLHLPFYCFHVPDLLLKEREQKRKKEKLTLFDIFTTTTSPLCYPQLRKCWSCHKLKWIIWSHLGNQGE